MLYFAGGGRDRRRGEGGGMLFCQHLWGHVFFIVCVVQCLFGRSEANVEDQSAVSVFIMAFSIHHGDSKSFLSVVMGLR